MIAGSAMKWMVLFVFATACSSDEPAPSTAAPVAKYEPTANAVPVAELRGQRLCEQLWPTAEIARATGASDIGIPAGAPRAGGGRLRCLYQWPQQGPSAGSVELRIDCRPLRPKLLDLALHWKADQVERTKDALVRRPATDVVQVHVNIDQPPCYLSVTAGKASDEAAHALTDVARARLQPQLGLALADYPSSASASAAEVQ